MFSHKMKNLKRIFALALIQVFLFSQYGIGFGAVPKSLKFNEKYGRVRDSFKGSEDRMIVHIQDAHCVAEAQQNIIGILKDLYKNHNVRLVSVEGADAYFDADDLASFPIESVKKDVAEYFLDKGRISGAEYLMIENELPLSFRGAENRDLYIDNYNAFVKSISKENKNITDLVDEIASAYENLKQAMLSQELLEIDDQASMYDAGRMNFIQFARYLIEKAGENNVSIEDYKNFGLLIKASKLEGEIDFAKIHTELSDIIDVLSDKIDRDQLSELLNKNLFYKVGKLSPSSFYTFIKNLSDETSVDISEFSNVTSYISYLDLYKAIDDVKVVDEAQELDSKIKSSLYDDPSQKELVELSKRIAVLKKLFTLKVSKKELKYYQGNKDSFTGEDFVVFLKKHLPTYSIPFNFAKDYGLITQRLPLLDEFYKIAAKRNEALIENTIAEMDLEDTNIAVLITGGFHTEGIKEILEEQGISYQVISPLITEQPKKQYYLSRLVGVGTEIEEQLTANDLQVSLVLGESSILPDVAKKAQFTKAFKTLLESHPDVTNLEELAKQTGYNPALVFTNYFSVNDIKYMAFEIGAQKFYMAVKDGKVDSIEGINTVQVGNYSFAIINQDTFMTLAQSPDMKIVDARSGLDAKLENSLAGGKSIALFAIADDIYLDDLKAKSMVDVQGDVVRPTISYLLNSRVSPNKIMAKVARVSGLVKNDQDVLSKAGIDTIKLFSNYSDVTNQDSIFLQNKLSELIAKGTITLPSGRNVRALQQGNVLNVYSAVSVDGVKPYLLSPVDAYTAMLPVADVETVGVKDITDYKFRGGINIDTDSNSLVLYKLGDNNRVEVMETVVLKHGAVSADIFNALLKLNKIAEREDIGLVGYADIERGIGFSVDNLDKLFEAIVNDPTNALYRNLLDFVAEAPSLQDIDLTGVTDAFELKNKLLEYTDGTAEDNVTCAIAAGAVFHDQVKIGDEVFADIPGQREQILTGMLPLIDQRMKGKVSVNANGLVENSLYSIAKTYQIFGQNSQALFVRAEGPSQVSRFTELFETLDVGDTMILHFEDKGIGHFVAFTKRDDGYFTSYDFALNRPENVDGIGSIVGKYYTNFTGNVLIAQKNDVMGQKIAGLLKSTFVSILDRNEQLDVVGSCGVGGGGNVANIGIIGAVLQGRGFDAYGRSIKVAYPLDELEAMGFEGFVDDNAYNDLADRIQHRLDQDTDWSISIVEENGKKYLNILTASRGVGPATMYEDMISADLNHKMGIILSSLLENVDLNVDAANDKYEVSKGGKTIVPLHTILQHTRYKTKGDDRPENAHHEVYDYEVDGLDTPVSVSLGFNGDFESYMMYKNILKDVYADSFISTSDTEVVTHLFARLSVTKDADGNMRTVPGQIVLKKLFRLIEAVESMLNASNILKSDAYSEGYRNALISRLQALGMDPDLLTNEFVNGFTPDECSIVSKSELNNLFDSADFGIIEILLAKEEADSDLVVSAKRLGITIEGIKAGKVVLDTEYESLMKEKLAELGVSVETLTKIKYKKGEIYPVAALALIYNMLDNPNVLDDGYITENGFFGEYKFFALSQIVSGEFAINKAVDNITTEFTALYTDHPMRDILLVLTGESELDEFKSGDITADKIRSIIEKVSPNVAVIFNQWKSELMAAKTSTDPAEWATKRAEMISEFQIFATNADRAGIFITNTGKVTSMTLNVSTGQDLNHILAGRFGPKSTDCYMGIGEVNGQADVYISSEPRAFGPLEGFSEETGKAETVLEDVLELARGSIEMASAGNYGIFYLTKEEMEGKSKEELSKSLHRIDALTGEETNPEVKKTSATWNKVLDREEYSKLSAFEIEASAQSKTIGWTLDNLTEVVDGKNKLKLGLNDEAIAKLLAKTFNIVGAGSGTSLNGLQLAMEEARSNGLQLMDMALDADIVKTSYPVLVTKDYTVSFVVSQSGTTGVAIQNAKRALNDGGKVLVLTNREGSTCDTIAKGSLWSVITRSVDESAVAATGSNTNQVIAMRLLSLKISLTLGLINEDDVDQAIAEMRKVPNLMLETIKMCRDDDGMKKILTQKDGFFDYLRKTGIPLGDVYKSMNNANIMVGGIGLSSIANEYETKMTELFRSICGSLPLDFLHRNNITENPSFEAPDQTVVDTKVSTLSTMLDKYAKGDKVEIYADLINLTPTDIKNAKRVIVIGGGQHTHTLEHLENTYMPIHGIPVVKRKYSDAIKDIKEGDIVVALAPDAGYEKDLLSNIINQGAKVVVVGQNKQRLRNAGLMKTFGKDALLAEYVGADLLLQHISTVRSAQGFETAGNVKKVVDALKSQIDGMKKLFAEFYKDGTNNRVNMDRMLNAIRNDKRGWNKLSSMNVAKVGDLASSANAISKMFAATGNMQIYKELATMKHGYYAPLFPGGMVFLFMPRKGEPGRDNVNKGIAEYLPRINFGYDAFRQDHTNPIGLIIAVTPENPADPMIRLMSDEEFAELDHNTRFGKEDLIQRPNIVFHTTTGGMIENMLMSDLIAGDLHKAYKEDQVKELYDADQVRGNVYINIEFPVDDAAKLELERQKIKDFRKNFPNGYVLTIVPESVEGVEEYSDAVIRIPAADSTLALAVNHYLSLELIKARVRPILEELNNLFKQLETMNLGEYTPANLFVEYVSGNITDGEMDKILAGTEYGDKSSWKYYKSFLEYVFRELNVDPVLTLPIAGISVDASMIYTIDLIKGLAKVVTNDNLYTANEKAEMQNVLAEFGLNANQISEFMAAGPMKLENGVIKMSTPFNLQLIADIRGVSFEDVKNEGIRHELIHMLMNHLKDTGVDITAMIGSLSNIDDVVKSFNNEYYGVDMPLENMVDEMVAKYFTNKFIPNTTSEFFKDPLVVDFFNNVFEGAFSKNFPDIFNVLNTDNTDDLIRGMQNQGVSVSDDIIDAIEQGKTGEYLEGLNNLEFAVAMKMINLDKVSDKVKEAMNTSDSLKESMAMLEQDLQEKPNVTAINADIFDTKDGLADSNTIGLVQDIKKYTDDESNIFVVYSMDKTTEDISKLLAGFMVSNKQVIIVGSDLFKQTGQKVAKSAEYILSLPGIITAQLGYIDVTLWMRDLSIIENNKEIAAIASTNYAVVIEVAEGLTPQIDAQGNVTGLVNSAGKVFSVNERVEVGVSALELADMLEKGKTLPGDLIVTAVSDNNKYLKMAYDAIVKEKKDKRESLEVTITELRDFLGRESLSRRDLRALRVKRKLTITEDFIQNLKHQRLVDTMA